MIRSYNFFVFFLYSVLIFPYNTHSQSDRWVRSNGPFGGTVHHVAVHPHSDDIIATGLEDGLYITSNGGLTWIKNEFIHHPMHSIVMVTTNSISLFIISSFGIHKSTNMGGTWNQLCSFEVFGCVVDTNNPDIIYAGSTQGKVCITTDSGFSWIHHDTGSKWPITSLAVSPHDPNIIFAGTQGDWDFDGDGLFKTTDVGHTWSKTSLPCSNITSILIDPKNTMIIYVGTLRGGLYKSIDEGITWETANAGFDEYISVWDLKFTSDNQLYAVWSSPYGLYRSIDGGMSWYPIEIGGVTIENICYYTISTSNSEYLYIGSDYGLLKGTSTGGKFSLIGVKPVEIMSICINPYETNTLYAIGRGIFKSTDRGNSWELFNRGAKIYFGHAITIDPTNSEVLFAGDYGPHGAVYKTENGGLTWTQTSLTDVAVNDIVINPNNPNIIYAGGLEDPFLGGLFKSLNTGTSWDTLSNYINNAIVKCIEVDPEDPLIIYVGTQQDGIYKSIFGGSSWFQVNNGLPPPSKFFGYINDIAIDPSQPNILYAGVAEAGVYKTTNGGYRWYSFNEGLTNLDVRVIVIDPHHTHRVFVGTYGDGVFQINNNGKTWKPINDGWDSTKVSCLAVELDQGNKLFAGSYDGGVWSYKFSSIHDEEKESENRPSEFYLFQNYPNPFNSSTIIRYNLLIEEHVTIVVYNLIGEKVAVLVNKKMSTGEHNVRFIPGRLACGIYYYQMQAGDFIETKKLLYLK